MSYFTFVLSESDSEQKWFAFPLRHLSGQIERDRSKIRCEYEDRYSQFWIPIFSEPVFVLNFLILLLSSYIKIRSSHVRINSLSQQQLNCMDGNFLRSGEERRLAKGIFFLVSRRFLFEPRRLDGGAHRATYYKISKL